jgi:multidrug efflux system membrane fusion protein
LHNVVTVPTSAIQRGAPGAYVYMISADSTVSVRQITTGPIDGDLTAVNSGLSAGDRVVTDGTDRLRDGLHVSVAPPAGQPAGAPRAQYKGAGGQGRPSGGPQGAPPAGGQ